MFVFPFPTVTVALHFTPLCSFLFGFPTMQYRANLGKTLADFVFVAAIVGMIVLGATQLFGHIFLWRHGTGPIDRKSTRLNSSHT